MSGDPGGQEEPTIPPGASQDKEPALITRASSKVDSADSSGEQSSFEPAESKPVKTSKPKGPTTATADAAHRRQMESKRFDQDQSVEKRNFWVGTAAGVMIFLFLAYVGFSGNFEHKGGERVREVLVTLLSSVIGVIVGRLTRIGEGKPSPPPPAS